MFHALEWNKLLISYLKAENSYEITFEPDSSGYYEIVYESGSMKLTWHWQYSIELYEQKFVIAIHSLFLPFIARFSQS